MMSTRITSDSRPSAATCRVRAIPTLARIAASLLSAALLGFVCEGAAPRPLLPAPAPGLRDSDSAGLVPVPGGVWNAAGGNLLIRRTDLVLDSHVGPVTVGASWNSADARWLWSFDIHYDGAFFVDETGASHDLRALPDGASVPGTKWLKVDADTVKTQGGLAYDFGAGGRLSQRYWLYRDGTGPEHQTVVRYESGAVAGRTLVTAIVQCDRWQPSVCTPLYQLDYDPATGRLRSILDRAGRRAEYAYDAAGRLRSARDGLDVARGWPGQRYEYSADGRDLLTALTGSEGERAEYVYASDHSLPLLAAVTLVGEENPLWSFAYGNKGAEGAPYQSVFLHSAGAHRIYSWNPEREIREVAVKLGPQVEVTRYTWLGGRPRSSTDPHGLVTRWLWVEDRLTQITLPSGRTLERVYDVTALNQEAPDEPPVRQVIDAGVLQEQRSYNAFGQIEGRIDEAGDVEQISYVDWANESHEHVQQFVDTRGRRLLMRLYKEHGHAEFVFVDWPGVYLFDEPDVGEENVAYDAVGNLLRPRSLEDRGGMLRRVYDEDRNLVRLWMAGLESREAIDPIVGEPVAIEVDWRSDGRPREIRRPHGGDTRFEYDAVGRLRRTLEKVSQGEIADGHWQETRFSTDGLGRPTRIERGNGMWREFAYDAAGRLALLRDGRGGIHENEVRWDYDLGRLAKVRDASAAGDETYEYDEVGRVGRIIWPGREILEQEYDAHDRIALRRLRRPDASLLAVIETRFNALGEPQRIALDGSELYRREPTGQSAHWRDFYGNGVEVANEPASLFPFQDGRSGWRGPEYGPQWRSFGITQQLHMDDYDTGYDDWACVFCLSETAVFRTWDAAQGAMRIAYAASTIYDLAPVAPEAGAELPGLRLAREFPCGEEMVPQPLGSFYSYDALNNVTVVERSEDSDQVFVYNAERNRLLAIRDATTGEAIVSYAYDEAGFASSRNGVSIGWTAGGRIASLGDAQHYRWNLRGELLRANGTVSLTRRFGGLVEGDASAEFARLDLGSIRVDLTTGERFYFFDDVRGNPLFALDDEGELVAAARYQGYGGQTVLGNALAGRGFALGRPAGELVIVGARIYDPLAGRFLSPDPILQIVNQYAYTNGNPLLYWDPAGLHGTALGNRLQAAGAALTLTGIAAASNPATAPASPPLLATGGALAATGTLVNFFGTPETGSGAAAEGTAPAPPETPAAPVAPGAGTGGGAGPAPTQMETCAPERLGEVPRADWLIAALLPLQIALALLLTRSRRPERS